MNEIGLDPGLDHLYAIKTIEEVHAQNGKIKSFLSYCGGLPSAENSDNPLGYKFSWSSRGVLLALRNAASYWENGDVINVKSEDLMATAKPYYIFPGYALVCYPNRDSTPYKDFYSIPEAETVIRGTLRFQGFPEFIKVFVDLGLLSDADNEIFTKDISWKDALAALLGTEADEKSLVSKIKSLATFKEGDEERILSGFKWLGLFSDNKIIPKGNPLDTLCATLEELMQYEEGEKDLVILQHKFGIEWANGETETRTSTLVDVGAPIGSGDYSSMAKLVGVPCAVATQKILDGTLSKVGLLAPYTSEINDPIMKTLKDDYGIYLTEKTI